MPRHWLASSATWVRPGAVDTGGRCRTDLETFGRDRSAADFALPVLPPFESFQRPVHIFQVLARLPQQGDHVSSLEGGGATFGIVLIVYRDQGVRRDNRIEVAAQCSRPSQGVRAVGLEAGTGGREGGRTGLVVALPGYVSHAGPTLIHDSVFPVRTPLLFTFGR